MFQLKRSFPKNIVKNNNNHHWMVVIINIMTTVLYKVLLFLITTLFKVYYSYVSDEEARAQEFKAICSNYTHNKL